MRFASCVTASPATSAPIQARALAASGAVRPARLTGCSTSCFGAPASALAAPVSACCATCVPAGLTAPEVTTVADGPGEFEHAVDLLVLQQLPRVGRGRDGPLELAAAVRGDALRDLRRGGDRDRDAVRRDGGLRTEGEEPEHHRHQRAGHGGDQGEGPGGAPDRTGHDNLHLFFMR